MRIVDTHVHIWNTEEYRLPWLDGEGPTLNRVWSAADYQAEQRGQGDYSIDKAVYIEVDMAADERPRENALAVELVDDPVTPFAGACISGDLSDPGFADYIRPWAEHPQIKGVRQVLHVPSAAPGTCLGETFADNVRLLGELGLVFEGCVRNPELADLATLARRCPQTTVIVDHMGIVDADIAGLEHPQGGDAAYMDAWKRNMDDLGGLDNTVCKVSGLNPARPWNVETLGRAVNVAFASFPSDRLIFASNFPVLNVALTLDEWIRAMLDITADLEPGAREAFFASNAERVYRL
ncbi:amidohydrolase family protein [Bifidobacterium eulemuris]|uniref:Amidohydrolase n=1 Tax=Bifidobacterium eulemuris TaxID=1765219 RepID=A0A261G438_9BIFI|nr:amidohydrolase family protein [Bifidobacterium eulemuris]OZG65953.1 amidohydrolase [Bifidobacterium eulemuris]QOL32017.1 amidohydrolase family protein [Bifidobacterium eulemuris]